jgi:hypothetical protein
LGVLGDSLVYLGLKGEGFILVLAFGVAKILSQLAEFFFIFAFDFLCDLLDWIDVRLLSKMTFLILFISSSLVPELLSPKWVSFLLRRSLLSSMPAFRS